MKQIELAIVRSEGGGHTEGVRRAPVTFPGEMVERRASDRFPIQREVRYKVLNKKGNNEAGTGRTIDMSSGGILFTTEHPLAPGRTVEVAVSWPAQLNSYCALKLVARGRVVRCEHGKAAIEIQHYEFRTQASGGPRPS